MTDYCSRFCKNTSINSQIPPVLFYSLQKNPANWKQFAKNISPFLEKIPTAQEISDIVILTTEQSENPHWKHIRIGRITASMVGMIYRSPGFWQDCSRTVPPASIIKKTFGLYESSGKPFPACMYGLEMESVAADLYKKYYPLPIDVEGMELRRAGLFLSHYEPWLAASPDFIVNFLPAKETWLIEVKSFVPVPNVENFKQLVDSKKPGYLPYYYDQDGVLRIKHDHKFYYQIQCQLYVTGMPFCDLVLFYKGTIAVVRIQFNRELWHRNIYPELYAFYYRLILPEMYFKRIQRGKLLYGGN